MTKKEIAAVAEEFGMTSDPFSSRIDRIYYKKGSEAVDVDFGICSGGLYFGVIFESEHMAERNVELTMPIEETTPLAARTILKRLFEKAHFFLPEAEMFTHAA
jgi:hypothetical protein